METYQDLEEQALKKKINTVGLRSITLWMSEEQLLQFEKALWDMGIEIITEEKLNSGTTDCNTKD